MAQADQLLADVAPNDAVHLSAVEKNIMCWRSPSNIDQVIYCTRSGSQFRFIDTGHLGDSWMPHMSTIGEPVYTMVYHGCFIAAMIDKPGYGFSTKSETCVSCYICPDVSGCHDVTNQHRIQFAASSQIANISGNAELCIDFMDGSNCKIPIKPHPQ
jgi:hypothetical protein